MTQPIIRRRAILGTLATLVTSPAIIRSPGLLMPVRALPPLVEPRVFTFHVESSEDGIFWVSSTGASWVSYDFPEPRYVQEIRVKARSHG